MRLPALTLARRALAGTCTAAALLLPLFVAPNLSAQELTPAQKQSIQKALEHLKNQDFIGGRPLFEQLIKDFTGKPAFASYLDDLYFYLARSYYDELKKDKNNKANATTAIDKFKDYESKFPQGRNIHYSFMSRVDIYLIINERKAALEVLDTLLSSKYNSTIPNDGLRQEAKYKFTRLCYELEDWNRGIPQFKKMIAESSNDNENKSLMTMYLGVAYMRQAISEAEVKDKDKPTIPAQRAVKLMEAVTPVIPHIDLNSIAHNDLYFNGVLFNTGELLYRSGLYVEASFFYYQTQGPKELTQFFEGVAKERRSEYATLINTTPNSPRKGELEDRVKEIEERLKEIKDIKKDYTPYLKFRKADCLRLLNRFFEAHFAFLELSNEFKSKGPAELNAEDLWWQSFDLAIKAKMLKRAVQMGDRYLAGSDWPKLKFDKEVMLKLIDIHENNENSKQVLLVADKFLQKYTHDRYAKLMVFKIGSNLVKGVEYDKLKSQMDGYFTTLKDKQGFDEIRDGLLYWRGISNVLLQDFDLALPDFTSIVKDFAKPEKDKKKQEKNASDYWEDSLFREAICNYGLQNMSEAEKQLKDFVTNFPDSNNRGEAHLYLGDLYSGKGKIDSAIENYKLAIDFTVSKNGSQTFIDHSTFQIGRMQEQARKFADMQKTYEEYIERFKKSPDADLSNAIFNLGRAFAGQHQPDKTLDVYYKAIDTYGDNPRSFGLDNILLAIHEEYTTNQEVINDNLSFLKSLLGNVEEKNKFFADTPAAENIRSEITKKYPHLDATFRNNSRKDGFRKSCRESDAFLEDQFLVFGNLQKNMPAQAPIDKFTELYKQAKAKDKQTLALRLLMAADRATGKALNTFTFTEADLTFASPATLVWIAQKTNDKSLAVQSLNTVLTRYKDSDFGFDALIQLGSHYEKLGDLTKAQDFYRKAGDSYPSHPQSFISYIREGDVMTKLSKFDDAKKLYEEVLRNPAWKRNEAAVEAKYKLGVLFRAQKKYTEAAAAFTRIYIANPASNWAPNAYLDAAISYGAMGDSANEQLVYQEYLKNPIAIKKNPEIELEILKRVKK